MCHYGKIFIFTIGGVLFFSAIASCAVQPAASEKVSLAAIFSDPSASPSVIHKVQNGETLGKLAKQYGTTVDLIKRRNHIERDTIRIGQTLSIWTGKLSICISKSKNTLALKYEGEVLKEYPVSTGYNSSTPAGEFTIVEKLVDPVWYHHGVVVPPGTPDNFLGSRWLGLDKSSYGIHGTVEPELIGQPVSSGCVRMLNSDVEELYSVIPKGTKVVIEN